MKLDVLRTIEHLYNVSRDEYVLNILSRMCVGITHVNKLTRAKRTSGPQVHL